MEIFTDKGTFPFAAPSVSDSFYYTMLQRSREVQPTRKSENKNCVLQSKHTTDTLLKILPCNSTQPLRAPLPTEQLNKIVRIGQTVRW